MIVDTGRGTLLAAALAACLVATGCTAGATADTGTRARTVAQPTETLVPTPPMGLNNWNAFGCDVTEELIKQTADVLVSSGLADAGYEYVNIDDCWSLRERDTDGRLVPDPEKFPSGISGVADYVHGKGLKLGIYGDAGTRTCAGHPGSLGHEEIDARTWADWGVDYLKYDNCDNQSDGSRDDLVRRYTAMRDALDATGRPIVYAICERGQSQPWEWADGVGDLWRTTGDISDNWLSLRSTIARNAPLHPHAGPGHWNDPDLLEIGNGGMTDTEYRTHMSMWAMMAAPLLIGTDLRTASEQTLAILGHRGIIAIDQDPLGVQGAVVSDTDGLMVLDKPLADGDRAIALYNSTDALATVGVPAGDTGLAAADAYQLTDVWSGDVRQSAGVISAAVPAHGTVVYRVRPLADPTVTAPSVTVGATVETVISGGDRAVMTIAVVNRGAGEVFDVRLRATGPAGWTIGALGHGNRARMATDEPWTTRWGVQAPEGTPAGAYPVTVTATYTWGPDSTAGSSTSEVASTVVTAPPDGRRHLSTVAPVRSTNAVGPVEVDASNGGAADRDGALLTIAGRVYTRGLGTTAPSEIVYHLGGRCSTLVTDVGVDDQADTAVPATFTVLADDVEVATSGEMAYGDAPKTLTADLTGAKWLKLVTTGSATSDTGVSTHSHADWAAPVLTCGDVSDDSPVLPVERTIFSFESDTDGFTVLNTGDGGGVARTADFHTDGGYGLALTVPPPGQWYGRAFAEPLDLSGMSTLKFDLRTGANGTAGEIAVQVGEESFWCPGRRLVWTDPGSSRTVTQPFNQLDCPKGVTVDPADIRAVWVFVDGDGVAIDNVRAG